MINHTKSTVGVLFTPPYLFASEQYQPGKEYKFIVTRTLTRDDNGNQNEIANFLQGNQSAEIKINNWTLASSFIIKSDWTDERSTITIVDPFENARTTTIISNPATAFRGRRTTTTIAMILNEFVRISKKHISWEEFDLLEERQKILKDIELQNERLLEIKKELERVRR